MLTEIFAAFRPRMPTWLSFEGPNKVDENAKPPRITWSPDSAIHLPPKGLGARGVQQGPMATRQWNIIVEIWGETLDGTIALTDMFLAIANDLLSRYGFAPGTERWLPGGVTGLGSVCQMVFHLQTPILKTAIPSLPIDDFVATYKMNDTQL